MPLDKLEERQRAPVIRLPLRLFAETVCSEVLRRNVARLTSKFKTRASTFSPLHRLICMSACLSAACFRLSRENAGTVQRTWQRAKRGREKGRETERERSTALAHASEAARTGEGGTHPSQHRVTASHAACRCCCQTIGRTPLASSAHYPLLLRLLPLLLLASHERRWCATSLSLPSPLPPC